MENGKGKINPIIIGISAGVIVLIALYVGMSIYFTKHFYFGTIINGIKVTGKTVVEVESEIENQTKEYSLELDGRDGQSENISSDEINLQYVSDGKVKEIKNSQNGFLWITSPFKKGNNDLEVNITYDKEKLDKVIDGLNCLNDKNIINPQNAKVEYDGEKYVVKDEVLGNKIIKENLKQAISEKIEKGLQTLNIDESSCYENPVYTKDSDQVKNALDTMNNFSKATITYQVGDKTETLDSSKISSWIYTDDNLNVDINKQAVSDYALTLANKYNTIYTTRSFKTTSGNVVNVVGGDYGWQINISGETDKIIENIKSGEQVTREPVYAQKAVQHGSNDLGNSYVEVNLSAQHLWVYVNGSVVVETDFVSGSVAKGTVTPAGTYMLKYKVRDQILTGANNEYNTAVKYWMPFNGGIGLHDANWRPAFGGTIYQTDGSHGCVNLPVDKAEEVFNNVNAGIPVICYN